LLQDEGIKRVMIFTKSRKNAEEVYNFIERKKLGETRVIHANKGQNTRINSMEHFKAGDIRILVATDVASRGLDVSMVSHVINFDVPLIYEDYVHRIGRTGRAEQEGAAITFVNPVEEYHFERIEQIIRMEVPVEEIPSEVKIAETPFAEKQAYDREIDNRKKKDDPDYQGAFHEKKAKPKAKSDYQKPAADPRKHQKQKAKRNRNQMKSQGKHKK
jgi:ATP-dependent RNA helicase RhlE